MVNKTQDELEESIRLFNVLVKMTIQLENNEQLCLYREKFPIIVFITLIVCR